MKLVLASSSRYRRTLLERLNLAFEVDAPDADESPRPNESPHELVARLSLLKAEHVASRHANALIIGSDQVAVTGTRVLGKPGNFERTVAQLELLSGRNVTFLTGLCVLNTGCGRSQVDVVPFEVKFKRLTDAQIRGYVSRERPYDCAGGFRSEGLGVALFESVSGDATALVGLPLIRLVSMLAEERLDVLTNV